MTPTDPQRTIGGGGWIPQATVFVSSFCIMVLELVAGRVISRHLGSSLYTWTSVIGVVLAGIALGNYIGGRIADRRRAVPALATLFIVASAMCVTITILNNRAGEWVFLWTLPWPVRVGTHVSIVFLLPSVILGMISPIAAKMALDRSTETGRTIGSVYAWGVIGSIVGTFATGFYLIAAFGTGTVIWAVAATLAAMAVFFGVATWQPWIWGGVLLVLATLGVGPWAWAHHLGGNLALRERLAPDVIYFTESQYSSIEIIRVEDSPEKRNMHLDKLLHSSILLEDPFDHQYSYERIYSALTAELAGDRDSLNTLTIGGGGYTYPRYVDAIWPRSRTEVVEIDPAVTEAAILAFGLPADHDLIVHHEDGRAFLNRQASRKRAGEAVAPYDFVYMDAVNDYSVPYQLTTIECVRAIDELLADDGAFLMNMIDVFDEGHFLGSMIETMKRVFPYVAVFVEGDGVTLSPDLRETFIIAGTKRPQEWNRVVESYPSSAGLYRFGDDDLATLRARSGGRWLTDDWAPVENLLAPVVNRFSRNVAAGALCQRARAALRVGKRTEAIAQCERALSFSPKNPEALALLANIHMSGGRHGQAIALYEQVLARHPQMLEARLNLARALVRQRRLDDAERLLREAADEGPARVLVLNNLGTIQAGRGNLAEAARTFERVVQAKPDYLEARLNLALTLLKLERVDEAVAQLEAILARDPSHRKARQSLEAIAVARAAGPPGGNGGSSARR